MSTNFAKEFKLYESLFSNKASKPLNDNVATAPKKLTEALSSLESQNLTNAANERSHLDYFVEIYYCLKNRLAKRFNVNTDQSDFWNTFAHDVIEDIEYDKLIDINAIKTARANAFAQEFNRNMTADEQSLFDAIITSITKYFEPDYPSQFCRVLTFQSAADLYELEVSGWYSEDIDFDDCEEAFESGWNNKNVDYSTEAQHRGYHSDWIDAMQSIYGIGKRSREFFDYLDTI